VQVSANSHEYPQPCTYSHIHVQKEVSKLYEELVSRLQPEEIVILNSMNEKEALNQFSSLDKSDILTDLNLTESAFRKSINRLEATCFINVSTGKRKLSYYLSQYGQQVIRDIKGVEA
jgi:DNA-binding MarR family transcriptional regulator